MMSKSDDVDIERSEEHADGLAVKHTHVLFIIFYNIYSFFKF